MIHESVTTTVLPPSTVCVWRRRGGEGGGGEGEGGRVEIHKDHLREIYQRT